MKQFPSGTDLNNPTIAEDLACRALLATQDWSISPLGMPEGWPQQIRTAVALLLDSQFPMYVAWGPSLCMLYNDAYANILGVKHPEAFGQPMAETWSEIWREVAPIVADALSGKAPYFQDLPLTLMRKGFPEQAWFTFSYSQIYDDQGRSVGLFCTVMETTLRILSERRQAFQLGMADLLRTLTEPETIMPAAIDMLGRHLEVARALYVEVDEAGETFVITHQWHQPEVAAVEVGRRRLEEFGPEIIAALRLGRMVMVDDVARDERTAPHAQAYAVLGIRAFFTLPMLRSGRLVGIYSMHQGEPYHWSGTDILLSQDMMERSWAAMERACAEAGLREAGRRKDEFLAMLAHELRNPLAPISAAAELMGLVQLDADRVRHTSQVIMRQVRHMTGLVDDLLDVSRVTRGLVAITKTTQDLHQLVANAVEQVRPIVKARHHQLTVTLSPRSAHVAGDAKRLVQIVSNLLNNAAKYTPEGGEINLRMECSEPEVRISISDNGMGIPDALQSQVFELFAQAERTPDRTQGGLGLGLALVKSLAELHDGSVSCHSAGAGCGSTFTVILPRLPDDTVMPERRKALRTLVKADRPLRVLVVDDNVDAADMLAFYLEALGHDVSVENDAYKGIECAQTYQPEVCLLDIGLPGMDGNELVQALRQLPGTAEATMIAVTGYGQEHDRMRALEAGFDHHLVKPLDTVKLVGLLEKIGAWRSAIARRHPGLSADPSSFMPRS